MEIVSAVKQRQWRGAAVANFTLVGMGTGFYSLRFLIPILEGGTGSLVDPGLYGLLAPVLVVIGFIVLTTEAGRPVRGCYLFINVRHAWMSREVLVFTIFISTTIVDWYFPYLGLRILAISAALGLMVSQGFVVYASRAVAAWNVRIMPVFFLSSGLMSGGALVLIIGALGGVTTSGVLLIIGIVCISLNLSIWLIYLYWNRSLPFLLSTKPLHRPMMKIVVIVVGHIAPVFLLLLAMIRMTIFTGTNLPDILTMISGFAMIIGVIGQKYGIILAAGKIRGIELIP